MGNFKNDIELVTLNTKLVYIYMNAIDVGWPFVLNGGNG